MTAQTGSTSGKLASWAKTVIGALAGMLSGAAMMYLSPLVDKVVRPAKPVANFAIEQSGLTATFHNRSFGKGEGWWDFGDGSPLEPVSATEESVRHTYASPGIYTVKMTLRNLLGEESERTVTLQLESRSRPEPPAILALDAVPITPGAYAPATFRISSKVKNAALCVWDYGDERPLEFTTPDQEGEKLVTFSSPGSWVVKVAAVNGTEAAERTAIVYVDVPPRNAVTAILHVAEQATQVQRVETKEMIVESLVPNSKNSVQPINRLIPARQGYEIVAARCEPVSGKGRDLKVQVSADRRSVRLTGELIKTGNSQSLAVKVHLTQERRTRVSRPALPVTTTLPAPGSGIVPLPPVPPDWVDVQRQLRLELRDGDRIAWASAPLPQGAAVAIGNRTFSLSARPIGDQVRVDLADRSSRQGGS
jgi:hypothetical protein